MKDPDAATKYIQLGGKKVRKVKSLTIVTFLFLVHAMAEMPY